jgi:hypothetical protein
LLQGKRQVSQNLAQQRQLLNHIAQSFTIKVKDFDLQNGDLIEQFPQRNWD